MRNVNMYTPQELALEINSISWEAKQCDDMHENEKVRFLIACLEQLPNKHAIRLLMHVLEVQNLISDRGWTENENPFRDMDKFEYLETALKCYNTDESPYQPYK